MNPSDQPPKSVGTKNIEFRGDSKFTLSVNQNGLIPVLTLDGKGRERGEFAVNIVVTLSVDFF